MGKSTLLLSILGKNGSKLGKTVYVSSEEGATLNIELRGLG